MHKSHQSKFLKHKLSLIQEERVLASMQTEKPITAQPGSCLEIEILDRQGNRERLLVNLVPDDQADYENGFIGISAPLAQALTGESSGYLIPFFTQEIQAVQIISIQKSNQNPAHNSSASRKASLQETLNQIEYRDAILFAYSANTKWGSYDPDGLDYEKWKSGEKPADSQG